MQVVHAEMQTGNAVYVADMGKNSSVRMAKTRPSNERMHRDYPVVHFNHHRAEIQQSEEEIKVNYAVD